MLIRERMKQVELQETGSEDKVFSCTSGDYKAKEEEIARKEIKSWILHLFVLIMVH